MNDHLLTTLVLLPALAGIALMFVPRQWVNAIRWGSLAFMAAEFALSLQLLLTKSAAGDWAWVSYANGYNFVEKVPWIEAFGIHYAVGVDGISLWLILLSTLLTPIALWASWISVNTKVKEYAIAFLFLETGMIGAFLALDLFLFYVFWELMLVPMYLIVGMWGGPKRVYAAVKFFLFTMVGSLIMLVAILYVVATYKQLAGHYTFDIVELTRLAFPTGVQYWLFGAFALAFAIKVPMFPVHTWLPDAHVQAPTGGSVILAAVLLKLGGYGFIRFAMPLFPTASHDLATLVFVPLALIGIVYGAWCAWVQKDVKKLVAYSSVSHMGFVMLGLFSMNRHGLSGSILQMLNHGVSTGALFILVGVIYERRHTRDLSEFGGLAKVMPIYATLFIIVTMSSIGLPGTNGFVGEFMIIAGTFTSNALSGTAFPNQRFFAAIACSGVLFAAIYMLHAVLKMFWGPITKKVNENLPDIGPMEVAPLVPLLILIFWVGLYPNTFLKRMEPSVDAFITQYQSKLTQVSDRFEEPGLLELSSIGLRALPITGGEPQLAAAEADAAPSGNGAEAAQ